MWRNRPTRSTSLQSELSALLDTFGQTEQLDASIVQAIWLIKPQSLALLLVVHLVVQATLLLVSGSLRSNLMM
jgi:hypothetical protein